MMYNQTNNKTQIINYQRLYKRIFIITYNGTRKSII